MQNWTYLNNRGKLKKKNAVAFAVALTLRAVFWPVYFGWHPQVALETMEKTMMCLLQTLGVHRTP